MKDVNQFAEQKLEQIAKQNLLRWREVYAGTQNIYIEINSKQYLNYSSNNYLGLANHPSIISKLQATLDQVGVGSGASHVVIGHHKLHSEAENALAEFLGVERCLLFTTGYMANLGVITALLSKQDKLFQDKLNHVSLIQAGILSGATARRYPHLNLDILNTWLTNSNASVKNANSNTLIATDAVFSMDGDIAPIPELMSLAKLHQAWLMVDDAHGFGVIGKHGRGTLSYFNIASNTTSTPVYMATLSKALGVFGAFVAGKNNLIEYIMQISKSYIYTTAIPPILAQAIITALKLMQQETWRQEKLQENIDYFKKIMLDTPFKINFSNTAIQTVLINDEVKTVNLSIKLREKGIIVMPIRTPTVPKNKARLRIALCAQHSKTQINYLRQNLIECFNLINNSNNLNINNKDYIHA